MLINDNELRRIECEMLQEQRIKNDVLECAACGFIGKSAEFYNSSVHNKFKICPVCGTIRFVCEKNRGYMKAIRE